MNDAGIYAHLDSIVVRVVDMQAAREWYDKRFRLKEIRVDKQESQVWFDLESVTRLVLWQLRAGERLAPPDAVGTYPVLSVDNIDATYKRFTDDGVAVMPLQESGGRRWFRLFDLDGNVLEVAERRD